MKGVEEIISLRLSVFVAALLRNMKIRESYG
jgi:hypothetical protein